MPDDEENDVEASNIYLDGVDDKKEHEELKAELLRSLPDIRGDVKSVLSKL